MRGWERSAAVRRVFVDIHDRLTIDDIHYLTIMTYNPHRCWGAKAAAREKIGLQRVNDLLGPEHPIPGYPASVYHEAAGLAMGVVVVP